MKNDDQDIDDLLLRLKHHVPHVDQDKLWQSINSSISDTELLEAPSFFKTLFNRRFVLGFASISLLMLMFVGQRFWMQYQDRSIVNEYLFSLVVEDFDELDIWIEDEFKDSLDV